jgi:transaldolase
MPPNTIDNFRDHGHLGNTLEDGLEDAERVMANLVELGINLDEVSEELQADGVAAFANSFDGLMATLEAKVSKLMSVA